MNPECRVWTCPARKQMNLEYAVGHSPDSRVILTERPFPQGRGSDRGVTRGLWMGHQIVCHQFLDHLLQNQCKKPYLITLTHSWRKNILGLVSLLFRDSFTVVLNNFRSSVWGPLCWGDLHQINIHVTVTDSLFMGSDSGVCALIGGLEALCVIHDATMTVGTFCFSLRTGVNETRLLTSGSNLISLSQWTMKICWADTDHCHHVAAAVKQTLHHVTKCIYSFKGQVTHCNPVCGRLWKVPVSNILELLFIAKPPANPRTPYGTIMSSCPI